jgi:hypothetical protein
MRPKKKVWQVQEFQKFEILEFGQIILILLNSHNILNHTNKRAEFEKVSPQGTAESKQWKEGETKEKVAGKREQAELPVLR